MTDRARGAIIIAITFITFTAVFLFIPPVHQPEDYHHFADARTFFGIPRTWDVLSNLGFLLVGAMGIKYLLVPHPCRADSALARQGGNNDCDSVFIDSRERWPYLVLFAGVLLTCFGSGYYHLAPDDARLVWDRLPMTLGFMGLLSAIIAERISTRLGLALLGPLLVLGVGSVFYWQQTDDLRAYAFVQFFPALLIPLILWLYPARYTGLRELGFAALGYVAAKLLEAADRPIFSLTNGTVSGHTLKHLAAAWGVWWLLRMLQMRRSLSSH